MAQIACGRGRSGDADCKRLSPHRHLRRICHDKSKLAGSQPTGHVQSRTQPYGIARRERVRVERPTIIARLRGGTAIERENLLDDFERWRLASLRRVIEHAFKLVGVGHCTDDRRRPTWYEPAAA